MAVKHPGLRAALLLSPAAHASARLVRSFAEREIKALYKRNVLSWLWSLLKPLTTVAVYSLVFGVIYRATAPSTANGQAEVFALYLSSGPMGWYVFHTMGNDSMRHVPLPSRCTRTLSEWGNTVGMGLRCGAGP
ncbi:MAG: hypothetical protein OXC06_19460 [Acidimicrobiaceae bacterium]|nr:hypothetical protein [Acidimicrobiaceae bacterium]